MTGQRLESKVSDQLYERARSVIPGGLMSNLKKSDGFVPFFKTEGRGARLLDVDGNEHIDYNLSYGSAILGHSDEFLREAVGSQLSSLATFHSIEKQIEAAERLRAMVPSCEMVRFTVSGVEANRAALRLARAATGRNQYVRFQGHYHGQMDHLMGGFVREGVHPPRPSEGFLDGDPFTRWTMTAGRSRNDFDQVYLVEWNDLEALRHLFESHGDDICAVITEPVMLNFGGCIPSAGFLEGVRRLCDEFGVVLIFDEVLTGFRIATSGAQGVFGVTPDLTTFGKALGGGIPVAAVGGRQEIMSEIADGNVIEAGTFNGHPLAMAAVCATLEVLSEDGGGGINRVHRAGERLREGLESSVAATGHRLVIQGFDGCLVPLFTDEVRIASHGEAQAVDWAKGAEFVRHLANSGIEYYGRFCTSAAHTSDDIDETVDRLADVLARLPL